MNILAHLAAFVALGWLVQWLFIDLSEPILGVAALIVLVLYVPLSWVAIMEDKDIVS